MYSERSIMYFEVSGEPRTFEEHSQEMYDVDIAAVIPMEIKGKLVHG